MNKTAQKVHKAIDRALKVRLSGVATAKKATQRLSCVAVYEAIEDLNGGGNWYNQTIQQADEIRSTEEAFFRIVKKMGLKDSMMYNAYDDVPSGRQRQLARAIWLDWVKLMLEEGVVKA